MLMPPVRTSLAPAVLATVYCTVPLPLPGLPLTMVIQETLLTACQRQPGAVFTVNVALPPPVSNDAFDGASAKVQGNPLEGAYTCPHHVANAPVRFDGGI